MRPVEKRDNPIGRDFDDYEKAKPYLISRIGQYCSYCERYIPTNLAVEHIQPKDDGMYPHLIGKWDNFLLACVNCNSSKSNKDVVVENFILPDRDNTHFAYKYPVDGKIELTATISDNQKTKAKATLSLVGLDKKICEYMDENDKLVAIDRVSQRMEARALIEEAKSDWLENPTEQLKRSIGRNAKSLGYFSLWLDVFQDDQAMRHFFIHDVFAGTALDCFDAATQSISPRNSNLTGGGKI